MTEVGKTIFKLTLTLILATATLTVFSQRPEIKSVDKLQGNMNDKVTLKGNGFGTDATKLAVFFGGVRANILAVTDQILEVSIPAGTTYDNISVTNLTTGRTGYSDDQFFLSFNGNPGFNLSNLQGQFDFPATTASFEGLYDLCMCDFDGDKKIDVVTANDNSSFINVYLNTSSGPGNVNFGAKNQISVLARTLQVKCGDLNGDGKPDIVATESGTNDKVFILKNNTVTPGSPTFSSQIFTLTGKRPKRIELADLDLDGRPEIILSTQGSNSVSILSNLSTTASIIFAATPTTVSVPNAVSTDGLAVEDLNGDQLPEIITSQFQTNTDIYIISNNSTPGSLNLAAAFTITVGTAVKNIRVGDLDGDGKADIAFTQLTPSAAMNIALNTSSGNTFSFGSISSFETDATPWGLDFGDLDGDTKPDIVVASITKKSLTIFNNTSTPGSVNFQKFIKDGLDYITRHVQLSDVDNDGKTDITFTSIDNATLNIAASKVSVLRNATCMTPQVTPSGPLNVCAGFPLQLVATSGGGVTYDWTNLTTSTTTTSTNTFSPTTSGDYQVKATSEGGACTTVSNIVKVTISPGTSGDPAPSNDGPTCLGNTINLKVTNDQGVGYTYKWTGPNGYAGTGLVPTPIPNAKLANAGEYFVEVVSPGGCVAFRSSTIVTVVDIPDFKVALDGSEVICGSDIRTLKVFPQSSNFTYEWYKDNTATGVTVTSFSVGGTPGSGGVYFFKAKPTTGPCPDAQSGSVKIIVAAEPVPAFSVPSSVCKGQEVTFDNQSVVDNQTPAFYTWTFGDGQTSTDEDPLHTYTTVTSFNVKLVVSYKGNACSKNTNKSISVTDAPTAEIFTDNNIYEICEGGSLELKVSLNSTSYQWNTGASTPTLVVTQPGDYSVKIIAPNGCELKPTKTVGSFPSPVVTAAANPTEIEEGNTVQLTADGLLNYVWTPIETLNDPNIAAPIATPLVNTTYTVSGTDANGCSGSATVEVKVKGEAVISKLEPSNFFSPNADAFNNNWTVGGIKDYPQCGVVIYDDKGVKVFEAKPYLDNWDGTYNGKKLPDGVYYFVIRCDGEESKPRMGSITILR
jgi:gliding motility-associated-like protein